MSPNLWHACTYILTVWINTNSTLPSYISYDRIKSLRMILCNEQIWKIRKKVRFNTRTFSAEETYSMLYDLCVLHVSRFQCISWHRAVFNGWDWNCCLRAFQNWISVLWKGHSDYCSRRQTTSPSIHHDTVLWRVWQLWQVCVTAADLSTTGLMWCMESFTNTFALVLYALRIITADVSIPERGVLLFGKAKRNAKRFLAFSYLWLSTTNQILY